MTCFTSKNISTIVEMINEREFMEELQEERKQFAKWVAKVFSDLDKENNNTEKRNKKKRKAPK